jgi:hypothetical protein
MAMEFTVLQCGQALALTAPPPYPRVTALCAGASTDFGVTGRETMRGLNRVILDFQHGRFRDDATATQVEWKPDRPGTRASP